MATDAPQSTPTVIAQFSSEGLVLAGGVAIFHIASQRVVICSAMDHGHKYYFLPKGRRDPGEESGRGAEREGYEEVLEKFNPKGGWLEQQLTCFPVWLPQPSPTTSYQALPASSIPASP